MRIQTPPDDGSLHRLTIFDLKHEAHGLIDHLVLHGKSRGWVYNELRKRLDVPFGFEHLAKMSTMTQVQKAIFVLKEMKREQKHEAKLRRKKNQPPRELKPIVVSDRKRKNILNQRQIREALDRLKLENEAKRVREERLSKYPQWMHKLLEMFWFC